MANGRVVKELCKLFIREVEAGTLDAGFLVPELLNAADEFGYLVVYCEKCGETIISKGKEFFELCKDLERDKGWQFGGQNFDVLCKECASK